MISFLKWRYYLSHSQQGKGQTLAFSVTFKAIRVERTHFHIAFRADVNG